MPERDYYLPSRQLVAQNDSAIIESPTIPRSKFHNAWTRKTTFNAGRLVPFLCNEILPGDHMKYRATFYVRMSTPLFPIFDNQRLDTFFFFVPNRLVWTNWARFMGEQDTPASSIAYTIPQITAKADGFDIGSLFDYFNTPTIGQTPTAGDVRPLSALPFRAYNLIYNQWFRDQNIINSVQVDTDDGPDAYTQYTVLRRAKSHDYFTSALPWPQKFTAPATPLSGVAPIIGLGVNTATLITTPANFVTTDVGSVAFAEYFQDSSTNFGIEATSAGIPKIYANLAAATGVTINAFRNAYLVQSLLERDARGGTRYVELIRSHFGVTNPDFRLQRPEYIGGGQTPLQITPIAQTAPSDDLTVGALGATGTAVGQHTATYAATEHGWIIGILNIRSELSYQQGLHKQFQRLTRLDHYFPATAQLGEQAILTSEIYQTGNPTEDAVVFGYQERWHELRTWQSEVTGMFRSNETGTLDSWHLAQWFATPPTLSQSFIEDDTENILDRVLAAGSTARTAFQQYLADIMIQRTSVRPLPMFGTPALLGRF